MLVQRIVISALLLTFAGSTTAAAREGKKGGGARKESRGVAPKRERKSSFTPKTDGSEVGKVGRYQLLPVEYVVNDLINETTSTKKDLVLLDTATGQMKICTQKSWLNVADGKEISERRCTPFETYGEYPVGTMKGRKSREGELSRP